MHATSKKEITDARAARDSGSASRTGVRRIHGENLRAKREVLLANVGTAGRAHDPGHRTMGECAALIYPIVEGRPGTYSSRRNEECEGGREEHRGGRRKHRRIRGGPWGGDKKRRKGVRQ